MKKIYMLSALLCASLFSITSCVEENFETPTPANDGDEIVFGARAGFETPGTKTVYAGEAGYYEDNGKKFERIDWLDEQDAIQIFCPEADGPNPSHYTVYDAKAHGTQKDYAYLSKNGESSLRWNGDGVHHFYAMYPSSDMFTADQATLAQGIVMDGTILRGTVPGAQAPISIECTDGVNWIAQPNMKYAYMAARSTAIRTDGSVSLTFVPIVTAVQIQLTLASDCLADHTISIAELQVEGNGIVGNFYADLSEDAWTGTYPNCVNDGAGNGIVQIPMWKDQKPITITPGQTLTFTVFLRPGADYQNLKVSYSPTGAGYLGKTIGDATNPVALPKNLKTVIKGVKLPARRAETDEEITIDASKWMTQVADEIEFKKLSIPGTGGSFSYKGSSEDFRSQHTNMTISQQWKAGIRAFEIISDRPSSGSTALSTTNVTCNKQSVGMTVGVAIDSIHVQLQKNPNECAVLIFTYQPKGNSPRRNATDYAKSLAAWYKNCTYKDQFKLYEPSLTLGQVRGKILVLVRLNQRDEAESGTFDGAISAINDQNCPFLLIDGCGTSKDKWGARGYTITTDAGTIVAPDISNDADVYVENYMKSSYIDPTTHANVRRGEMNFAYNTNTSVDVNGTPTSVKCWYQEWARVIPENLYIASGRWSWSSYPATYWFESYSEKLSNAVETFKMAISDLYPSYVFVNTLSGYMATEATKGDPTYSLVPSVGGAYGGDGGDIDALATKLNADFYKEVLAAGMEQTTGPTGIVVMDYVSNTPNSSVEYDGAYLLPGVIIANNFKHGSGNGSNTPVTPGEGGGNGGGNNTETPGGGDEEDGW